MSEQRFSGMEQKFGEFQKRIEGVRNEVENILNSERGKDDMMRKSGGAGIQSFEDSNRTEIGQYRELSKIMESINKQLFNPLNNMHPLRST